MAYKETIVNELQNLSFDYAGLKELQEKASNAFQSSGLPTIKHEEWKFTNLAKVFNKDFNRSAPTSLVEQVQFPDFDKHTVVFENGFLNSNFSDLKEENGIIIEDLSTKLTDNEFITSVFNKSFETEEEATIALNTAFLQGGVYIKVKKSQTIEAPVYIQHIFGSDAENIAAYSRIIVDIEENAECTIIQGFETLGDRSSLSNFVGEINVADNARLKYYILQNDTVNSSQLNNIRITQGKQSVVNSSTISLDGELIRNNLSFVLNDEHIESNFSGLYLLKGKTHVDNHTVADHKFPNCVSNELYKGIMTDTSRGVFNGKIFVRQDAQNTNAFQSNNNILLSDDAIINTKPQLEIWADDVSCSHGCTVGQLDEEALFYLKSRGLGESKAKALLLESFAAQVIDTIDFEPVKEYVSKLVSDRLNN